MSCPADGNDAMAIDAVMLALEEQVECYRRLAKLADAQHEHVQHSATESLLQVLGLRQQVLDRIGLLEQTVGPARQHWMEYAGTIPRGTRLRAEAVLGEIRRLLERITAADRNDAIVLQQRKMSLARQLGQTAAARQVNRSYAMAAYGRRKSNMDVQR